MTLWAILLPVVYIPGWTGAAVQTGWAYICLTVPIILLWRQSRLGMELRMVATCSLVVAILSLFHLSVPLFGGEQLMQVFAAAWIFWLGTTMEDLRPIVKGLAYGTAISVPIALAQYGGWTGIPWVAHPAGLFLNPISFGNVCATLILLTDFWIIPFLFLGLLTAGSRGPLLALAVGAIARFGRWTWLLAIPAVSALAWWLFHPNESDGFRLHVWHEILTHWSFLGHGLGSLSSTAFRSHGELKIVGYAHNEFLDTFHNFGFLAIPWWILLVAPLTRWRPLVSPAYIAWLSTALWSFPLHSPVEATLGALLAGNLLTSGRVLRPDFRAWRQHLAAWAIKWERRLDPFSWGHRSLQPTNLPEEIR